MTNPETFEKYYDGIEKREKEYLLNFLFELTIVVRSLNMELTGEVLVNCLKQINEINHRVLTRLRVIEDEEPWCGKEYLIEMVPHHANLATGLQSSVSFAALKAYEKTYT